MVMPTKDAERISRTVRNAARRARAHRFELAKRSLTASGLTFQDAIERSVELSPAPQADVERVLADLIAGQLPSGKDLTVVTIVAESFLVSASWLLVGNTASLLVAPPTGAADPCRTAAARVLYAERGQGEGGL